MPIFQLPVIAATSYSQPLFLAISIIICFAMTFFAFYKRLLDIKGAIGALAIGLIISIFTDITWLLALIGFLVASSLVTRVKINYKKKKGLAEGKKGERGLNNVIANGFIPCFIALFSYHLDQSMAGMAGFLFLVSLSTAASDTFASEVGVISDKVVMITNFKKVPPGTDGGISPLGEASALGGAVIVSFIGWLLISDMFFSGQAHILPATLPVLVGAILIGWVGCQIDSILGGLFQVHTKLLSNDMVNFVSIAACVLISWAVLMWGLLL